MNRTPPDQARRADRFRALHERDQPFVVPNPWDAGSARLLDAAGFAALATTSAGAAAAAALPDGHLGLDGTVANVAAIVAATDLPVSADLETGYGDDPAEAARAIRAAAAAGAVGGSIEDRRSDGTLLPLDLSIERVRAAVDAARALPHDFVVTARCEELLGTARTVALATAIARLQAYQEAGADVLYAPGLSSAAQIRAVVAAVDRPVNVVMGLGGSTLSVAELGELGVRRISVGSALARLAYGALIRSSEEIAGPGTFTFAAEAVPYATLQQLLTGGRS